MNINYEYYRIFYYVAKYKNLTQAAKILHNNQPNVSRTIKLLEHELDCKLLIRSNRGISLTPEGERLYHHIKIAVEQIQAAEDEIVESIGMQKGIVTIGASETALRMLVLPALNQFKEKHPDIRIRIVNHLTTQALDSVQNGSVDFAVITTPANITKPLISQTLIDYKDILICGSTYSLPECTTISLNQLTQYPLVCLGEKTMTYNFYDKFYRQHNLILKPELEAATTDQILPMIKSNLGIGFIPPVFAEDALRKKEIRKLTLTEEIPSRKICFVENESFPLNIAAKELKKIMLQYSSCIKK